MSWNPSHDKNKKIYIVLFNNKTYRTGNTVFFVQWMTIEFCIVEKRNSTEVVEVLHRNQKVYSPGKDGRKKKWLAWFTYMLPFVEIVNSFFFNIMVNDVCLSK